MSKTFTTVVTGSEFELKVHCFADPKKAQAFYEEITANDHPHKLVWRHSVDSDGDIRYNRIYLWKAISTNPDWSKLEWQETTALSYFFPELPSGSTTEPLFADKFRDSSGKPQMFMVDTRCIDGDHKALVEYFGPLLPQLS